jgi:ethanolamine kinase
MIMALGQQNGDSDLDGPVHDIRFVPLSYSADDGNASALRIITHLRPDWADASSNIEFVRFTDGITNTLLKAVNRRPGLGREAVDAEAILLRAYGNGTDLLIDRHREAQNHELLGRYGLAPALLARFENGMLYRFVRGEVTSPEDLRRPTIYQAVARRLAQWHATVPCLPGRTGHSRKSSRTDSLAPTNDEEFQKAIDGIAPGKPSPNVWTVMQKWIFALPTDTEAQRARQAALQMELTKIVSELSQREGLGRNGVRNVASSSG